MEHELNIIDFLPVLIALLTVYEDEGEMLIPISNLKALLTHYNLLG